MSSAFVSVQFERGARFVFGQKGEGALTLSVEGQRAFVSFVPVIFPALKRALLLEP